MAQSDGLSWQLRASCQQYPTELFYPDERGHRLREHEDGAKRICGECPVLTSCREHALRAPESFGIWGALTARERANYLALHSPAEQG